MNERHTGFQRDFPYMQEALRLAQIAFSAGEIPIGAVVVDPQGIIIGTASNTTEAQRSQIFHAEMQAVQLAAQARGDWRLDGCTLYVTLQPCLMCSGMIALSRVERIVWAAASPLYGVQLDTLNLNPVYTKHTKFFSTGVMEDEAQGLLKQFFKRRRDDE